MPFLPISISQQTPIPASTAIILLKSSGILLLVINDTSNGLGIIPGKVFEYLASSKPIFVSR